MNDKFVPTTMESLNLKVGDIITTYYSGYFKLTGREIRFSDQDVDSWRIKKGDRNSDLFKFVQIMDKYGRKRNSKEKSCDASYCQKYDVMLNALKDEVVLIEKTIEEYYEQNQP